MEVPDALLGRRVALRHRLGPDLLTDAVGELHAAEGDTVVVHTRRGPVRVDRRAVVAVRAIPPAVPRRASWAAVARLEHLCADAWPARVDHPLGAWRLRAAGGFTGRANAALALGDPGLSLPEALDAVRAFAVEHGVQPRVQAPTGAPWERAVAAAGWVLDVGHEAGAEVAVLVADLDVLAGAGDRRKVDGSGHDGRGRLPNGDHPDNDHPDNDNPDNDHPDNDHPDNDHPDNDHGDVELQERPDDAWWALSLGRVPTPDERFVLDPPTGDPDGPVKPGLRTAFGLVPGAGVVRAAVVDDHLHLSRLAVRPDARCAGVGTALTAAAAAWGRERGARWAVLQVALHNTAARALYDRLGAVEHHRYRYLVPPPQS